MLGLELTPEHPIDDLIELNARAEREGYDLYFVSCHYSNHDPFAVLAQLATETDDIRLSPSVTNPYKLHPVTLTDKVATVAGASGGRGLLGIDPGDLSTLHNLGLEDECDLHSMLEAFKVAQKLWDGEHVSHDGTFKTTDAGLSFDVPGEVSVYVGGEGPHMYRMADKHAGDLLFNGSHPDDLTWARKQVDIDVEDRPDSHGEFTLAAYANVSVSEDTDAARGATRPPIAFIAAGATPPVLDRYGIDADRVSDTGGKVPAGNFSETFDLVTPATTDAFSVAGTPDDVADRMGVVLGHANGIVVGSPVDPDLGEAITLAAAAYRSTN